MTARADRLTHVRQNATERWLPSVLPILPAACASSSVRWSDWTTAWRPCWPRRVSTKPIWMTRTRASRVQAWGQVFRRALEQRPMKNAGMRLATVTPFGAFPLIDYLIATSQNVGEGLARLFGRYLRLAEAGIRS